MSVHIVFDPNVANGAPFFKGTHISVTEVMEKLAGGQTRDGLVQAYGGQIKAEAIAEALRLAAQALATHASAFVSQAGASAAAAGPGIVRGVSGELVLINPAKTNYGVGERVPFRQLIKNHTAQAVKYSFLGMLIVNLADGARRFHTSWSGNLVLPANGYGPQPDGWEDGVTIDAPGSYRISLDMCFASQDEGQKGVGWESLTAGTLLTIGEAASVAAVPGAQPPTYRSHGIVGNAFGVEKSIARVNEDVWFNFKVTNTTDQAVPYAILAARTESGQAAKSWSNEKLAPRQVLEWRDHINFSAPGTYRLYLGIGYGSFEDCFAMRAPWDRLSDSVTITIS